MATVPGIDVSRYQGVVNWRAVADAGFKFAVVRATLWDVKLDETFETNWNGARANGLLVSAYNVIKPDVPAAAQIDFFAQALIGHQWDLPPVLDIERDDKQTPLQITQCVRESLRLSAQRFGRKPIVYTAKWFWNKFVLPSSDWAQYDLWVASYGAAEIVLPDAWPTWKIWQYTGNAKDPYQHEHDLLFDAIRNDKKHNEAERCAKSCMAAIMGRMACECGRMITWEEALASNVELAPGLENLTSLDAPAPVRADASGGYPIAMPGTTVAL